MTEMTDIIEETTDTDVFVPDTDEGAPHEEPARDVADEPSSEGVDYEALAREDLLALQRDFPSLLSLRSVAELPNPTRYGALRDLGLSPREAYLAVGGEIRRAKDNRSHLHSSVPRTRAGVHGEMSSAELESARNLFGDLSDAEICKLYQKVKA